MVLKYIEGTGLLICHRCNHAIKTDAYPIHCSHCFAEYEEVPEAKVSDIDMTPTEYDEERLKKRRLTAKEQLDSINKKATQIR